MAMLLLVASGPTPAASPTQEWVVSHTGTGTVLNKSVAVDSAGNVLVTGIFAGTVNFGDIDDALTSAGNQDVFVVKLSAEGVHLWSRSFGGSGNDISESITVDSAGAVLVTGSFSGTAKFGGEEDLSSAGSTDVFVVKLSAEGTHILSQSLGGSSFDWGFGVAVDSSNNLLLTGLFRGEGDFGGDDPLSSMGDKPDIFVVKLDSNGAHIWSFGFGGTGDDSGTSLTVDVSNNVLLTGNFQIAVNFGGEGDLVTSAGSDDMFVVKLDTNGLHQWSGGFGGTGSDKSAGIASDESGNALMIGNFDNGISSDVFVTKLGAEKGLEQWSMNYVATDAGGRGITTDGNGNALLTGYFKGLIKLGGEDLTSVSVDEQDMLVAQLNAAGEHQWSVQFDGGRDNDTGTGISVDDDNNVYVTEQEAIIKYSQGVLNQAPVADAGPDQVISLIGTMVTLGDTPGRQSFDPDGDSISYDWNMTLRPLGSVAELSNKAASEPTFTADVNGEYDIELIVTDEFDNVSFPDSVVVSFNNVAPIADAGNNQSVIVGDTVFLDGSDSSDANEDMLNYKWNLQAPEGSGAILSGDLEVDPSFNTDISGTYEISLTVNDGLLDSDPDNIIVTAITGEDAVELGLREIITIVNDLDPAVFRNKKNAKALTKKVNAILKKVDAGKYNKALKKLEKDILKKTDGCFTGSPDKNDWIINCDAQAMLYPVVMSTIEQVKALQSIDPG